MIDTTELGKLLSGTIPRGTQFTPIHIPLTDYFPETESEEDVNEGEVRSPTLERHEIARSATPKEAVAIDTTGLPLGEIPDGIVGAVRGSVISNGTTPRRSLELHGAYVFPVTNQNSQQLYSKVFSTVYGHEPTGSAPVPYKMIDRVRNLLERHLQYEVVKNFKNCLILFDGSLIGGTVANPRSYLERIIQTAHLNNNSIAAISKHTALTLAGSQSSILSIAADTRGPCFFGDLRRYITQDPSRYLGEIFVAKLTPFGKPFRVDIPEGGTLNAQEILGTLSSYVGEDGYSEDLRLSHMTCVFSSLEFLELQAAAIGMYGMALTDNIRDTLFPFP
jgi:hypothetical protein